MRAARALLQQNEEDYDDGPELEIVEAHPQVSGNKKNEKARRAGEVRPDYWREVVDYYEDRLRSKIFVQRRPVFPPLFWPKHNCFAG